MGYSHRWERPQIIAASTFNSITEDFQKVLPALEAAGSPIANAWGREEPEITPETVLFNGVQNCGHSSNPGVRLAGPARNAIGIGNNIGMGSTLPYRTCNGDCSYETFRFDRSIPSEWMDEDGIYSTYCKTAFRPYDLAVTAFLLIAKHHLGKDFRIFSDGAPTQWQDAHLLCLEELGYDLCLQEVIA
ncbi:MAG: hypothetical protein ACRYGF_13050 [Janthinobacterium lividum]